MLDRDCAISLLKIKNREMNTEFKIILVEDNQVYTMMLDHKLKNVFSNIKVKTYPSAEDCLNKLSGDNPDLVVMDYYLPGMNGMEALKRIIKAKPGLPVVILSHQKELDIALSLLSAGAYDYIIKDEDTFLKLRNSIQNVLNQRKLEDENLTLKIEVNKHKITIMAMAVVILIILVLMLTLIF